MRINTSQAVSTASMSWLPKSRKLLSESSDFGHMTPYMLYDDACDFGFWIKSHKTGKLEAFNYQNAERDQEGDIVLWNYHNARHNLTLVVYND